MTAYKNCPKCEVPIGETHEDFCGVSRCKNHGFQLISCPMPGGCAPTKFTGYWPGVQEAIEKAWFYYVDEEKGVIHCGPEHEEALPDVNRVVTELSWNSESEKFE